MPYRDLLGHPLDVDTYDPPTTLTTRALYPEFEDRFAEAFDVICKGQSFWKEFYVCDELWDPHARKVVSAVCHLSYNIRQSFNRFPALGLAFATRTSRLDSSGVSDAQLVATLAMDRACRAIFTLWRWIDIVEGDANRGDHERAIKMARVFPDSYLEMVNKHREQFKVEESETGESFATYLGDARSYIAEAETYAVKAEADKKNAATQQQTAQEYRKAVSRKGSDKSAKVRRLGNAPRDKSICDAYERDTGSGKIHAEVVASLSKKHSLSQKQIKNILVQGKVWAPKKKRSSADDEQASEAYREILERMRNIWE